MYNKSITCILKPVNIIKTNIQQHYNEFLPEFSSLAIRTKIVLRILKMLQSICYTIFDGKLTASTHCQQLPH